MNLQNFLYGLFLSFCLSCCGPPPNQECPTNYYQNLTSYTVNPTQVTKSGISVDSSYPVDLDTLDTRILQITACIEAISASLVQITEEQRLAWDCLSRELSKGPFKLSCLTIKVVDPYPSCSEWQLLPVPAPDQLCIDKGLTPTPECPCMWRNLVQDDWVIITPPALYIWETGKVITGCNNLWSSPFRSCLNY
jgi:hypothetical protein